MKSRQHAPWPGNALGWLIGASGALAVDLTLLVSSASAAGPAGVKLDGTLGGSAVALAGPTFNITQGLGQLAGGNLFFSFQYFNIATGQTALFSTTSPGIGNVISRVTGGYASNIDGTIRLMSASGAPNFYFINPSGVTFSATAVVDVPASFLVTTANYLKFPDGRFYADPTQTSTLSVAAPEAFGFLGSTRAAVNLDGAVLSAGIDGAGQFQIVAGDVTLEGAGTPARVVEGSGDVRVIATGAQAAEVPLAGPFTSNDGIVALLDGGLLETLGGPASAAGSIYVGAGAVLVNGELGAARTGLLSVSGGDGSGPIAIDATGEVALGDGGSIVSLPGYGQPGADITLNAGSLTIGGASPYWLTTILTSTDTTATGGALALNVAGATTLTAGGQIASQTFASADAGAVSVKTGSLSIDGQASGLDTGIFSTAKVGSSGNTGSVSVTVGGTAAILNGAAIETATYSTGNAGAVNLTAASLNIDGGSATGLTGVASSSIATSTTTPSGNSGDVAITTSGLTSLTSGGQIESTTNGPGATGDVSVMAGSLSITDGLATAFTGISSAGQTPGAGQSGALSVSTTGATTIADGGQILAASGGDITVSAGTLSIAQGLATTFTGISSSALTTSAGNSGNVSVTTTGATTITDGGQILAASATGGNGGNVTLTAGSLTIDGAMTTTFTGITSSALSTTSGNSGQVSVATSGATMLLNGGQIFTVSNSPGSGGAVQLTADSLTIDAGSSGALTGILSTAFSATSGSSGAISVSTTQATTISNGGEIASNTYASGNGGDVTVKAGSLSIEGGTSTVPTEISSEAERGSRGNAGNVTITAGSLDITGASSGSDTGIFSSADAGSGGNAGLLAITTTGSASLASGGEIESTTNGPGKAGDVNLSADSLSIEGALTSAFTGISSSAYGKSSSGNAGQILVSTSGATTISTGGEIESDTFGSGNAGDVTLKAGSLSIDAEGYTAYATGILSSADVGSSGNAGKVAVTTAGATTLSNGGEIQSATFGQGRAGDITLAAQSVSINGDASSTFKTGLLSDAEAGSNGNAGSVTLTAGALNIDGGSATALTGISSSADSGSSGNAGEVSVTISAATTLSSGGQIISTTSGSGSAGSVTLSAGSLSIDGSTASKATTQIASNALSTLSGNAGQVSITTTGATALASGGQIASTTSGPGTAGDVTLSAGSLNIDGGTTLVLTGITSSADPGSTGNAGQILITTRGATTLSSGAEIQSATFASGNAGAVTLKAASLSIDAEEYTAYATGILSSAAGGSAGNAGQVNVTTTGATTLSNGAEIQSATIGLGNAGDVNVEAGSLTIGGATTTAYTSAISTQAVDGSRGSAGVITVDVIGTAKLLNGGAIASTASSGTAGQPGTISIRAGTLILDSNGQVSIANGATVANPALIKPTQIDIQAGDIQMAGGQISAASTGNIAASSIDVHYGQFLYMDPSTISTSSVQGNGGPITISGQGPLWLEDSNITTSVLGTTNGDGGDISIKVPYIVLSTGAIQANTLAPRASGGEVTIDAEALIPSYEQYVLGGNSVTFEPTLAGLNVVQAAAPDGVSGTLNVTVPSLDLGSSLLRLNGAPAAPPALGRSLCRFRLGSSLSLAGRGGLPVSARDPLWLDADDAGEQAGAPSAARTGHAISAKAPDAAVIIACR